MTEKMKRTEELALTEPTLDDVYLSLAHSPVAA